MTKQPAALQLHPAHLRRLAENALMEDEAWHDVTTAALVPPEQNGRGVIVAKAEGVLAGLPMAEAVFKAIGPSLAWRPLAAAGTRGSPRQAVAGGGGAP